MSSRNIITPSINTLPQVGNVITVFMTVILSLDNSLNQIDITSLFIMYGNVKLMQPNAFIANDAKPIALLVTGIFDTDEYIGILYVNAIGQQQMPNNFATLVQKIPLGIFNDISANSIVGQDMKARAQMIDDYYAEYFKVQRQVYSFDYSSDLEFEYNGTVGLVSDSIYPRNLFLWFSSLNIVALNSYDLELAISQYIFFRIGISCPVYCDDHVSSVAGYWNLGIPGFTELNSTTILAPGSFTPALFNLGWTIYNSDSFTPQFKDEVTALIIRLSRADIGNQVTYSAIVDPEDDGFTLVGFTYSNDPRTIFGKCIQYLGFIEYPLNIVAYVKT